jgi:hypothetical protein
VNGSGGEARHPWQRHSVAASRRMTAWKGIAPRRWNSATLAYETQTSRRSSPSQRPTRRVRARCRAMVVRRHSSGASAFHSTWAAVSQQAARSGPPAEDRPRRGGASSHRGAPCAQRAPWWCGWQGSTRRPWAFLVWTLPKLRAVKVTNSRGCSAMLSGDALAALEPGREELVGISPVGGRKRRAARLPPGAARLQQHPIRLPLRVVDGADLAGP